MKVWIEIRFDNCQTYSDHIKLVGVDLFELKLHAKDFIANLEGLQKTINEMVKNSVEDKTQ